MATTTLSNPASVADRLRVHFSKQLMEIQVDELRLDQFAKHEDLPMKVGSKTIRFFKFSVANSNLYSGPTSSSVVEALTEGVAPTNYMENPMTYVDVTLKQYGIPTRLSDLVTALDAFEPLKQNIDLMGRNAALHYDTVSRNALIGATHPDGSSAPLTHLSTTAGKPGFGKSCEVFITAASTPQIASSSAANFASLLALTQSQAACNRAFVLIMATALRTKKAPKMKGGKYACLMAPQVMHDLVRDSDYRTAFQGRGNDGIYKGTIGEIDGMIFVEHTNPFIEDDTYGTYASTDTGTAGLIYSTIAFGAGSFGVPKLAGSKSPLAPQVFIIDKPDHSNPLNQFVTAGWKGYYMAMGLDALNLVVGRCKSTFA